MGFRFTLATILILCVFPHGLRSQPPGCSFGGLHLDKCLNQDGEYIFLEPCCRALNQAVRDGFHCLCSMFAANAPQFTNLFSWSLSSCYIAIPPLTFCRDLGTMPISLPIPPDSPPKSLQTQPSVQENVLVPLPPPPPQPPVDVALPSTSKGNATVAETQPVSSKSVTPKLHVLENGNKVNSGSDVTEMLCSQSWLLSLAVYSLVLAV